jgi:hypothetical protein
MLWVRGLGINLKICEDYSKGFAGQGYTVDYHLSYLVHTLGLYCRLIWFGTL